jgi:ornithine--oxo-acid transaminase
MIENAARMGEYFLAALRQLKNPIIREVRGKGLLIGVERVPEVGGASFL